MTRAKESPDARRSRARRIIRRLKRAYPDSSTALVHGNPFELLIATILSAQCTDQRVNIVTQTLFKTYRSPGDFASAAQGELEREIHSTGFFRAKARNIIGCSRRIVERHRGKVPESMEELLALPGVGRKTANVVLGNAFGISAGVVVDTHVARLSGRLGFSKGTTPEKIEDDLVALIARKEWIVFPHLLISHGRELCKARQPQCACCFIRDECPFAHLMTRSPAKKA